MTENRVGVVIPTFNSGSLVGDAAESARECLGGLTNVVVVDDGSTDRRSMAALDDLRGAGFSVLRQPNSGVSAARNRGLTALTTPYAFVLDSDDLLEAGAASEAADVLDADEGVVIVAGSGIDFGDTKTATAPLSPGELTREDMWRSNRIATASAFRVEDWSACGGFPEGVAIGEDWVFWLRLLRGGGRVHTSDAVFVRHRIHAGQTTRRYIDPRESAKAANLVLRENSDLALAHPHELIDELCRTRALLAAYRRSYRRLDRIKTGARRVAALAATPRGSRA